MKKRVFPFFLAALGIVISGCSNTTKTHTHAIDPAFIDEEGNLIEPMDIATHSENEKPHEKFNEGVVLVKSREDINKKDLDLQIKSVERLYPNSLWQKIKLENGDTSKAVQYMRSTNLFSEVDYDYIMKNASDVEYIDVSSNPYAEQLPYIESNGVGHGWAWGHYKHNHGEENIQAGGSSDVIVAVIDTGVDYNHLDLANNIWVNTGEIPNNGIDDDGNGYVDDIHGWDCVNEDNNPIDDNGHGTHVAGIIAAENNTIGTIGVAFNCKVMPIKAGNSSGYFNNTDIAQAIQYAYMNGASVINMSFGGGSLSLAVQDALIEAYNQCVLVAAAGNNGMCNQPDCFLHIPFAGPTFPGALPYVIGVMSCNADGTMISPFSNYDHYTYNNYEYDTYACGEQIISTWPNNKYAKLSGTSMSTPVVSGIAALLRSAYPDRVTYSSKYINSQLTNTGKSDIVTSAGIDGFRSVCDAYDALTKIPTPSIYNLYNFYAFDNESLSPKNNGDGFIDAGETIKIGIELQNRGGKASNIVASIDTIRNGDPNLTDPNLDIIQNTIHMNDIGTYSIGDSGKVIEDGKIVDMENAFVVKINENTPNEYQCSINLHIQYENGLDTSDNNLYLGEAGFSIDVSSGTRLSGVITENTVFTADKTYLIDDIVTIPAGVTVEFTEGCKIQFYDDNDGMVDTALNTPGFNIYGNLIFSGTAENRIELRPSSTRESFEFCFTFKNEQGKLSLDYCDVYNMKYKMHYYHDDVSMTNSYFCYLATELLYSLNNGSQVWDGDLAFKGVDNCVLDLRNNVSPSYYFVGLKNSIIYLGSTTANFSPGSSFDIDGDVMNNVFINTESIYFLQNSNITIRDAAKFRNNAILSDFVPTALNQIFSFRFSYESGDDNNTNYLCDIYREYSDRLFLDSIKSDGTRKINLTNSDSHDPTLVNPYITNISLFNKDNEPINTVGVGQNKVKVDFSRAMDADSDFKLFYGSVYPYRDYKVEGAFISSTVWEGTFEVKATIEGGKQRFTCSGGYADGDSDKSLVKNAGYFGFDIDVSGALSMNLQANSTNRGVELSWVQDDYDTLMGYNIYRSNEKDGNYVKINQSVIPAEENTFIDDSCEPGYTYWYTFTVVLSDFSESAPAGKISAVALDTTAPNIYHNPVNQGYAGNNLAINCSISDNITVQSATLYYRTVGDTEWKSLPMAKINDRFSATIYGSDVTLAGVEYYISATDGINTVTRGSADSPFTVIVKDASLLSNLGDVDGDGFITTKDALMIIRAKNDEIILTDDQFQRADLNKDTILSTFEALRILQYINGNVSTLEM